ncbi:YpiF family protein [Jeotgalicoccus sp. WY2]|nr:YpiF family protein [Jeotgalicoccus sp. WY2]
MLYNNRDLRVLKDEIEFVDTAIVPVVSVDFDSNLLHHSNNLELLW